MGDQTVVERLKAYGQKRGNEDWSDLDLHTADLIRSNPFAFLVAIAFDRGMPWRKAWQIPADIDRKGLLDPRLLASMAHDQLVALLDELPVRPRYGSRQGAKTLSDAANLVHGRFGGSAGAIWEHASPAEVGKTLQEIHGLGSGIAAMATRILHDDFGCFRGQERQIDVKPDVHVVRVFRRTGLTESESGDQAIRAARRLSPAFPGALDWPAWRIRSALVSCERTAVRRLPVDKRMSATDLSALRSRFHSLSGSSSMRYLRLSMERPVWKYTSDRWFSLAKSKPMLSRWPGSVPRYRYRSRPLGSKALS